MRFHFLPALLAMLVLGAPQLSRSAPAAAPPAIVCDANGVALHGKRTILLIGTFQPSRQDPADWDRRLAQFAASGFNTLDCLVPWNFHEPTEGKMDFASPDHDLGRFLRLCEKHHLWVFLRSGPYVCDEWNGGGLPAWLVPKPGLQVRSKQAAYLAAVRPFLRALDKAVLPYQITRGGPVIWSQLENEMDFFGPAGSDGDRREYVNALRDWARQDGLDIPLTACVGSPGADDGCLRRAFGLAGGVLPTGNFYGGGAIEARARKFIDAVHGAKSADGSSLAQTPVICSETGRDENSMRRLLASGLKGVSPFNFVSGSNKLFNNGDTNWSSPVAFISSSVDFGGMISFSGVRTANWYAARRLAGFVNMVSPSLCRAGSDTNWEGGFSVSNAALGADEGGTKGHRVYRLADPNGPQFVFLWNDTGESQATTLTLGEQTLPRHSTLAVAPQYDHIVPVNVSLAPWGLPQLTLCYSTSELFACTQSGQTTTLTLTGNRGDDGEFCLSATPSHVAPSNARVFTDNGDWTAAYKTGETRSLTLAYGPRRLVIKIVPRQELDAAPTSKPAAQNLLAGDVWRGSLSPRPAMTPIPGPDPPTMEQAGIGEGAAWYYATFTHPGGRTYPILSLAHAGDIVTAYLNGKCLGTQIGVGNEVHFDTTGVLGFGANVLAVRVEVWGHSNFDDGRNPSLRLNSARGLWGPVRLDDAPLLLASPWQVGPEIAQPPASTSKSTSNPPHALVVERPEAPDFGKHEEFSWQERTLPLSGPINPQGYVLHLDGKNVLAHLFVNGHPLGRFLRGPAADPHLNGGPSDQFYIPAAWLHSAGPLAKRAPNRLSLFLLATGPDAALSQADWTPVLD